MPIKEALFWVGITVLGTGLFFVVEGGDRMPLAVSLTIFGVAVVAYSVYAHHKPDARYRVPIWVSLLIVTWLAIGYDYYDRHAAMAIPAGEHAIPVPKVKTIEQWPSERLEMVLNQTFANQEVRLDGRNYIKCTFKNVTFVYDGTAPTALAEPSWDGGVVVVRTNNPAIVQWSEVLRATGLIKQDANVNYSVPTPAPK